MIIVLFGKPGAGKGTQAPLLAAALGVPTLATGDELRAAIRAGTPLGLEAKAYMDRGDLVPDSVILGIIKQALSEPRTRTACCSTASCAPCRRPRGLAKVCAELGNKVDAVLASTSTTTRSCGGWPAARCARRARRRTPGREPGTKCDKDGGTLVRRKDDEPEAIRNRLAVYEKQTAPVLEWYRDHGTKVAVIDAVGPVQDVTARALGALAS